MAVFPTVPNRKKFSMILNLVKDDCVYLYRKYSPHKIALENAIEIYEEFMSNEINALFEKSYSTHCSNIALKHGANFRKFADELTIADESFSNDIDGDDDIFVMFIVLQEYLLQGTKGEQFHLAVDITLSNSPKVCAFVFDIICAVH